MYTLTLTLVKPVLVRVLFSGGVGRGVGVRFVVEGVRSRLTRTLEFGGRGETETETETGVGGVSWVARRVEAVVGSCAAVLGRGAMRGDKSTLCVEDVLGGASVSEIVGEIAAVGVRVVGQAASAVCGVAGGGGWREGEEGEEGEGEEDGVFRRIRAWRQTWEKKRRKRRKRREEKEEKEEKEERGSELVAVDWDADFMWDGAQWRYLYGDDLYSSIIAAFLSSGVYRAFCASHCGRRSGDDGETTAEAETETEKETEKETETETLAATQQRESIKIVIDSLVFESHSEVQFHAIRERFIPGGHAAFVLSLANCRPWSLPSAGGKSKAYFVKSACGGYVYEADYEDGV